MQAFRATLSTFRLLVFMTIAAGQLLCFNACQQEETPPSSSPQAANQVNQSARQSGAKRVMLATHPSLGKYLVDEEGRTLYISAKDVSGTSACLTRCTGRWPVFEMKHTKVSDGLNAADFVTITRPDGKRQTTYKGWPLYYFSGDTQPGDVLGETDPGNYMFVAKPDYTVMLADQPLAAFGGALTRYLVDAQGRTLYFFMLDPENGSVCTDDCLTAWPAFMETDHLAVPSSLDAAKFSVIQRTDGKKQLAYLGMPLYYYMQDTNRGQANGQLVENWTVAHLNW